MSMAEDELAASHVIEAGGWHPAHARVLAIATDRDRALAIVDGNGDGAELEAEVWARDPSGWRCIVSHGAGPLDFTRPMNDTAHGWSSDAHYAHGVAAGLARVTVAFGGAAYEVPVSPTGVWAFMHMGSFDASPPQRVE